MCKRKILRFLLFNLCSALFVPLPLPAMFDAPESDPVRFGMANAVCFRELLNDGPVDRRYLSVGGARLWGMPELQPYFVGMSLPTKMGYFGFRIQDFSTGVYHESNLNLFYSHVLYQPVSLELGLHLPYLSIEGYGSAYTWQLDSRLFWRVRSNVRIAVAIINLNAAHMGEGSYRLPRKFALGCLIFPTPNVQMILEMEKDVRYVLTTRYGLIYTPVSELSLLFTLQTDPDLISGGVSLKYKAVRTTASYQYHPELGFSQCYGISLQF